MCSMASFSDCHFAFMPDERLLEVGDALLDLVEPRLGALVVLALQGLPLDLQLHDLALKLVDLLTGSESISMRSREAASSMRSMALSGRKRSVM